jgi:F0F1-type ATP synthase assembly protein I
VSGSPTRRVTRPRPSQRAASVSIAMKQSRQAEQEGGQVHSHATGMNEGLRVLSYLIAGVALYGGLGWLADHLLGTAFWLPLGIVLGAAFAVYTIIRRFGRVESPALSLPKTTTGEGAR